MLEECAKAQFVSNINEGMYADDSFNMCFLLILLTLLMNLMIFLEK